MVTIYGKHKASTPDKRTGVREYEGGESYYQRMLDETFLNFMAGLEFNGMKWTAEDDKNKNKNKAEYLVANCEALYDVVVQF